VVRWLKVIIDLLKDRISSLFFFSSPPHEIATHHRLNLSSLFFLGKTANMIGEPEMWRVCERRHCSSKAKERVLTLDSLQPSNLLVSKLGTCQISTPECLKRTSGLVLLQQLSSDVTAGGGLDGQSGVELSSSLLEEAGRADLIPTLPTGLIEPAPLACGHTGSIVFMKAAGTEKLCLSNGFRTTNATGHLGVW
jgi:hypothetical protein